MRIYIYIYIRYCTDARPIRTQRRAGQDFGQTVAKKGATPKALHSAAQPDAGSVLLAARNARRLQEKWLPAIYICMDKEWISMDIHGYLWISMDIHIYVYVLSEWLQRGGMHPPLPEQVESPLGW